MKKELFYDIADVLRAVSWKVPSRFTSAIVVAAGNSSRMGGCGSKQMMLLEGMPVIVRTLRAYQQCACINEIIVVAKDDERDTYEEFKEKYKLTKIKHVVKGGEDRQESVLRGFKKINPDAGFVAIADGARCLSTPDMIERVCRAAYLNGAATAACPVVDTVKKARQNGLYIDSTLDRNLIWLAQTPQVFSQKLYRVAAYSALEKNFRATDDNSLVERLHRKIKLVNCGPDNIKITTPDDLLRAQKILEMRRIKQETEDPT